MSALLTDTVIVPFGMGLEVSCRHRDLSVALAVWAQAVVEPETLVAIRALHLATAVAVSLC